MLISYRQLLTHISGVGVRVQLQLGVVVGWCEQFGGDPLPGAEDLQVRGGRLLPELGADIAAMIRAHQPVPSMHMYIKGGNELACKLHVC